MPDWSRRRALRVAASAAVAALAGCEARTSGSTATPAVEPKDVVTDYEVRRVRNPAGDPIVRPADPEEREEGGEESQSRQTEVMNHLTDASDLDAWTFAGTDDASALRAFVGATDFESRSVLLYQRKVPACYEIRLVSVTRESDSVHADFCRARKPADVACDRNDEDVTAIAVRLPFAGDSFHGIGYGMSSSCGRRARPLDFDEDENGTATAGSAAGTARLGEGN